MRKVSFIFSKITMNKPKVPNLTMKWRDGCDLIKFLATKYIPNSDNQDGSLVIFISLKILCGYPIIVRLQQQIGSYAIYLCGVYCLFLRKFIDKSDMLAFTLKLSGNHSITLNSQRIFLLMCSSRQKNAVPRPSITTSSFCRAQSCLLPTEHKLIKPISVWCHLSMCSLLGTFLDETEQIEVRIERKVLMGGLLGRKNWKHGKLTGSRSQDSIQIL